jgi:hypothetical protein
VIFLIPDHSAGQEDSGSVTRHRGFPEASVNLGKENRMNEKSKIFLIKTAYWLGIGADALWAVGLLSPPVYAMLTGDPDFNPDLRFRLVMGVGATLMTGWTFLLLWAVRRPIERRFVLLLTAFPVVFGLFIVALIGVVTGNTFEIWILVKTTILFIAMLVGYKLASTPNREVNRNKQRVNTTDGPQALPSPDL